MVDTNNLSLGHIWERYSQFAAFILPCFELAGDAVLIGIGANDTTVTRLRPQMCAATGARIGNESIVRRNIDGFDVATDWTSHLSLEYRDEGFIIVHCASE